MSAEKAVVLLLLGSWFLVGCCGAVSLLDPVAAYTIVESPPGKTARRGHLCGRESNLEERLIRAEIAKGNCSRLAAAHPPRGASPAPARAS